ncbi:MAG: hypothetical protein ACP5SH_25765 [Syntrophobacteraceae bacterium]
MKKPAGCRVLWIAAVFLIAYPSLALSRGTDRETKKGCLGATINAIRMEIRGYKQKLKLAQKGVGPAGNAEDFKKRIAGLTAELKKYRNLKPENYWPASEKGRAKNPDVFLEMQKFGPISPPEKREISILADRKCRDGIILNVQGMTRSGPFYHVAGVVNGDYGRIKPNGAYKLTIYLVYKRQYFGFIPDYYVYVDRIQKTPAAHVGAGGE